VLVDVPTCWVGSNHLAVSLQASVLRQEIRDTHNRIDKEVTLCVPVLPHSTALLRLFLQTAHIRTQIEAQKLESVKYLAGVSFSIVTVVLTVVMGVWRLMK